MQRATDDADFQYMVRRTAIRMLALGLAGAFLLSAQTQPVRLSVVVTRDGRLEIAAAAGNRSMGGPMEAIFCGGRAQTRHDEPGFYAGACRLPRTGWTRGGEFDLAPLARQLPVGTEILVNTILPKPGEWKGWSGWLELAPEPERYTAPLNLRVNISRDRLMAGGFLLLVAALALAAGFKALAQRRLAFLFGPMYILAAAEWMVMVWALGVLEQVRFLSDWALAATVLAAFVNFAPPAIALLFAARSVPEMTSKGGLLFVPLLLTTVFPMVEVAVEGHWAIFALWVSTGAALILLLRRSSKQRLEEVSSGELANRTRELAQRAGVSASRLFVSSGSTTAKANAFAVRGRGIIVNSAAVELFGRTELDAVICHELSHLRQKNVPYPAALVAACLIVGTPLADLASGIGPLPVAAALLALHLAVLRLLRNNEFEADAGSAALLQDARPMIRALHRLGAHYNRPLDAGGGWRAWFGTHPATRERITALALSGGVRQPELKAMLAEMPPAIDRYKLPGTEQGGWLFNTAWQNRVAQVYGWTIYLGVPAVAVVVALLLAPVPGQLAIGAAMLAGLLGAKAVSQVVMAAVYRRMEDRLRSKLGQRGALTGVAPAGEARLFGGFRYMDAGLLDFSGGRLCYRSERMTLELRPEDTSGADLIPAAPAAWFSRQPRLQFRNAEGGWSAAILHPLGWTTGTGLYRAIVRWRASASGGGDSTVRGFETQEGEPVSQTPMRAFFRGSALPLGLAWASAMFAGLPDGGMGMFPWLAMAAALGGYAGLTLPLFLFRTPPKSSGD